MIAEAALEDQLAEDVMRLGAHGYTVSDVRGQGSHGPRPGTWAADRSIRMEVLCDSATSLSITHHVQQAYFRNFAVVVFVTEVGVLRPAKFSNPS